MCHTVVHGLEVVDQRKNIPMAHGDSLQHRDFVSDLGPLTGAHWEKHVVQPTICSRPAMSLLLMTFAA
jgi:hypothetical protein